MKNKSILLIVLTLFFINCGSSEEEPDVIYQYSTIAVLKEGKFDGNIELKGLKRHGDFGLGTYNGLDGEMVFLDGKFYQADRDGNATIPAGSTLSPFAVIADFIPDNSISVDTFFTCKNLKSLIIRNIEEKNKIHAIKISGDFNSITTRSVDKQNKPYPTLEEALAEAKISKFSDIKGELVGFWFPSYFGNINAPNFHFHFISEDRKKGGHMLSCKINSAQIEIDTKDLLKIQFN